MVNFAMSSTASWLAAGLYAVGNLQPVSAMLPGVSSLSSSAGGGLHRRQFEFPEHAWEDIKPSRSLEWQPCYEDDREANLQCARLIVPMDYENCASNQTVTLAVIKRPAQDTENYLGPVFVNPGGPGGSGVFWVAFGGDMIHQRLGYNHDIISWDPRGVGRSTPKQLCWANGQRRAIWNEKWAELDVLSEFDDPNWIRQILEQYKYEHKVCSDMLGGTGLLKHLHTAAHAHDLDRILTATGNDKLRFWGVSWGSVLATYYATLFPHKIERMVSEANVDVREWVQGNANGELADAQRHFEYFYRTCSADKDCAMHEPTVEGVKKRLDALIENLKVLPRVRPSRTNSLMPHLFTQAHARAMMDMAFRDPKWFLPMVIQELASLEQTTNETSWVHLMGMSERDSIGDPDYFPEFTDVRRFDPYNAGYMPTLLLRSEEITQCGDWPEPNLDIDYIQSEINTALSLSQTGGLMAPWKAWCAGATRPKKRFEGPFGGNTSFPILFVNGWDIVTPVPSAFNNAEIFPGSSVVTLDSYGHGITIESPCVNDHVFAYFQNGTLPDFNSTCADIPDLKYGGGWGGPWPNSTVVGDASTRRIKKRDGRPRREEIYEKLRSRESRLWGIEGTI
ncbi:Alpha/Beta hydrolase protein [Plectosphaerella plurivora]|uniref:Alpha/Beta hydrolase protein n=1 Tax=Plectosphaerella plurivora TaxID=936078 RepID=A0A9P9AC29_9PEZI|nr:Alpha/Beta hydrolase protein [Plectosphaerella plurivora]